MTTIETSSAREKRKKEILQFFCSLPSYKGYSEEALEIALLERMYGETQHQSRKQTFRERIEDPENYSLGPFEGEDVGEILNTWMDGEEVSEITTINANSESFDFLEDEPELYATEDLKIRYV